MLSLSRRTYTIFFLLTIISAVVLLWPWHDFQEFLAQGDHGRDLYAAQAVLRGDMPYRDFWWVYGPLMPYYYGACTLAFGKTIGAIFLGKLIIKVVAAVLIYAAMALCTAPLAAFFTAVWFVTFHQDFFFTYNHIGGIALILGIVWAALAYVRRQDMRSLWTALALIFILGLVKLNFGISCVVSLMVCVLIVDKTKQNPWGLSKKSFYAAGLIGIPFLLFISYAYFLHTLSLMETRQCLPYWGDDQPYNISPATALVNFFTIVFNNMRATPANLIFGIIINLCALQVLYLLWAKKLGPQERKNLILTLTVLGIFYVLNFHEYLKSGVWYRAFWVQPLSMMLSFVLIHHATARWKTMLRGLLWGVLGLIVIFTFNDARVHINSYKTPSAQLDAGKGQVYLTNSPQWIQTVETTAAYLNKTLKPDELFFALPYDCLYYYLTDRRSPTRQLIFFDHIKVTPEQERSVIAEIEKNRVNTVLISSRANAREHGLGVFGKTYCPLLARYINEHFSPVAQFGDWTNEPGWAWNHGTIILKRKKETP